MTRISKHPVTLDYLRGIIDVILEHPWKYIVPHPYAPHNPRLEGCYFFISDYDDVKNISQGFAQIAEAMEKDPDRRRYGKNMLVDVVGGSIEYYQECKSDVLQYLTKHGVIKSENKGWILYFQCSQIKPGVIECLKKVREQIIKMEKEGQQLPGRKGMSLT